MIELVLTLAFIAGPADGYYRPDWPVRRCRDLRTRILIERGQAVLDREGCRVTGGIFTDDFTRTAFIALDWREVPIEHLDPARRLWDLLVERDGKPPSRRLWLKVYTYRGNLWISDRETNARKGTKGPHEWCPESRSARRRAAASIRKTRDRFHLKISEDEELGLRAWAEGRCIEGAK